eukprot:gene21019-27884_t
MSSAVKSHIGQAGTRSVSAHGVSGFLHHPQQHAYTQALRSFAAEGSNELVSPPIWHEHERVSPASTYLA